ncbi:MAG TPA: radical SAM protein, partial [Desulfobulbaceae bacterium]|nr:radical SAM protein [Desulfobulbaceae bacterium]
MDQISSHRQYSSQENPLQFTATLTPIGLRGMQINLGRWCNQSCTHCHVGASPFRTETISAQVVDRCLEIIAATPSIEVVDLTGGAPEAQPEFRRLA